MQCKVAIGRLSIWKMRSAEQQEMPCAAVEYLIFWASTYLHIYKRMIYYLRDGYMTLGVVIYSQIGARLMLAAQASCKRSAIHN